MASLMPGVSVPVKTHVFESMQSVDIGSLAKCTEYELRPVLPALVRMALCSPLDTSEQGGGLRRATLKILSGIEVVNNIVGLLSIDFHALEQDVKKEQQLRAKAGGNQTESMLISQLPNGIALEFERSDAARRIRLILSQLLFVVSELKDGRAGNYRKASELFESPVYLDEVSDIICIAYAELPGLLVLGDVTEALLCLPHGITLLCQLVANFPELFMEVCVSLVSRGERVEEDSLGGCRRLEMLRVLADMNPRDALSIRALCVQHCTMPGLVVALSLQESRSGSGSRPGSYMDMGRQHEGCDIVPFVSSLLLGSDQSVRNWFSQFIKAGQKDCVQKHRGDSSASMLHALRQHLLHTLRTLAPPAGQSLRPASLVLASALVRLYSALKGIATLKYTEDEMQCLLELLTCHAPLTPAGTHFVTLAVCMLISCPSLLCGIDEEQKMVNWIRWLLAEERKMEREAGPSTTFGEMLFLVALHFHSNQVSAISDLVCNTLGMKSVVKSGSLSRLRLIFTQEIFTEQVIAAHAVKIPVTSGLHSSHTGYLPIHSIHQLLKSRVFSRHKVPIKGWIYRQFCESTLPLHPLLPQLVECFVGTIIPKGLKVDQTNQPFTEDEILALYSDFLTKSGEEEKEEERRGRNRDWGESSLAPQLLMLFYVLLYQDTLLSVNKSPVLSLRPHVAYSESVLAQIPINYLVQEAQRRQQQCSGIFPALLRLLVTHYPHLCLVDDWLEDSLTLPAATSAAASATSADHLPQTSSGVPLSQQAFQEAVSCVVGNPALMISQLQALLRQPPSRLHRFVEPVVTSLPRLLADDVPRKVLDLIQKVWFRNHALAPRRLRLATVNTLIPHPAGQLKAEPFTEQDVVVDPLLVLRCDERVFRCPPILAIVLRVLSAYLQASRVFLHQQVTANTSTGHVTNTGEAAKVEKDRTELKNALIAAQESACLQMLLEVCLPTPQEKDRKQGELNCLREVQCAVFSFLHQAFIQDPYLAKLIHFQGYPSELLPLMVAGVPSMHICLDFIPELLGQPQVEKQVFGIQLLAALCQQYSLPKSLNIARLAINVLFSILTAYESGACCQMFVQTVPSLLLLCRAFPPLCEDATSLLTQIARVCRSKLSVNSNTESVSVDQPLAKKMKTELSGSPASAPSFQLLLTLVQETFSKLTATAFATGRLY